MHLIEGTTHAVELANFEERVTALAAVTQVQGEDHPLALRQEISTAEHTLLSDLDAIDDNQPDRFEGEEAAVIITSLEMLADTDHGYQPKAQHMLAEFLGAGPVATETVTPPISVTPEPEKPQLPPRPEGFVTESYVVIRGFGELVAILRSGEEFATADQASAVEQLRDDLRVCDPFKLETIEYLGGMASFVYNWVNMSAARQDKYHWDPQSARLIELGKQAATPQSDYELRAA